MKEYKVISIIACYWNTVKKTVLIGIIKDIYPKESQLEFNVGDVVFVNDDYDRTIGNVIDRITEIVYEDYEIQISKIKKMDISSIKWYFSEEEIKSLNKDDLYEFRIWKPYWKTEGGLTIKWVHQIKKISNKTELTETGFNISKKC